MYQFIIEPNSGKPLTINSLKAKKLLIKYCKNILKGGMERGRGSPRYNEFRDIMERGSKQPEETLNNTMPPRKRIRKLPRKRMLKEESDEVAAEFSQLSPEAQSIYNNLFDSSSGDSVELVKTVKDQIHFDALAKLVAEDLKGLFTDYSFFYMFFPGGKKMSLPDMFINYQNIFFGPGKTNELRTQYFQELVDKMSIENKDLISNVIKIFVDNEVNLKRYIQVKFNNTDIPKFKKLIEKLSLGNIDARYILALIQQSCMLFEIRNY